MSHATRLAIAQPRTSRWPGDDPDCNRRHRHRGKHIPTVEGIGGLQIWLAPFRPELRTREVFQQLELDLRSGFRVETACESVIGRADQAGMDTLVGNTESGHPGGEARIEFGRCQSGHGHQRSTETLDTSKLISAFPCEPSIFPWAAHKVHGPVECSLFVLDSIGNRGQCPRQVFEEVSTCIRTRRARPRSWKAPSAIGIRRLANCATAVYAWRCGAFPAVGGRIPTARMPTWRSARQDRRGLPVPSAAARALCFSYRPGGRCRDGVHSRRMTRRFRRTRYAAALAPRREDQTGRY
jgi:hypothetical protein